MRELRAEPNARASDSRGALLVAMLEARRTAPPLLLVLLFGLTYAAARTSGGASAEPLLDGLAALEGDTAASVGVARASAATIGLALAALVLVVHAAGLLTRWRNGDADWLGARPIGATLALVAAFVGLACGAAALVVAVCSATALADRAPARELVWRAGPARHLVLRPGEQYLEEVRDVPLPRGALVRVRVQNTNLDVPYGDAGLLVERRAATGGAGPDGATRTDSGASAHTARTDSGASAPTTRTESSTRVARRTYVDAALPAAHTLEDKPGPGATLPFAAPTERGTLVIALTALGPGSLVVAGPSPLELWGPPSAAGWVDLALGGRALVLLVAAAVLAAGLGAWVAAPLAALATLAVWIGLGSLAGDTWPALAATLARWCPGSGLGAALDLAAQGRRPSFVPVGQLAGALGTALLALALARGALGSWRHAP